MNWLLVVVLVIFLIFIIRGWRRGLLRLLFSLISIIVLIVLVSYATPHISGFVKEHTGIYTMIENRCSENIQSHMEERIEDVSNRSVTDISLPDKVMAYLTDSGKSTIADTGIYQEVGARAADLILAGISFFIALILAIVIVKLIDHALGIVNHIPIIKGINRTLGLLGGAFEAFIVVSLLFMFFALIAGTELGEIATECIDDSVILSCLYYQNLLLKFFSFV